MARLWQHQRASAEPNTSHISCSWVFSVKLINLIWFNWSSLALCSHTPGYGMCLRPHMQFNHWSKEKVCIHACASKPRQHVVFPHTTMPHCIPHYGAWPHTTTLNQTPPPFIEPFNMLTHHRTFFFFSLHYTPSHITTHHILPHATKHRHIPPPHTTTETPPSTEHHHSLPRTSMQHHTPPDTTPAHFKC